MDCPAHGTVQVPSLGIIVSTIGRIEPLRRLLSSLEVQTCRHFVVSVCVQGKEEAVSDLLSEFKGLLGCGVYWTTSARGLSRGRNSAERLIKDDVSFLVFPNDTSTFPPTLVESIVSVMGSASAGGMRVVDEHGDRLPIPAGDAGLNLKNVWSVISPGLIIQRSVFIALGGFDESLGSGAQTPWQSAEETDLLLRYVRHSGGHDFLWLPWLTVQTAADARGLSAAERRAKLRAYARGYGRVLSMHGYGWWWYLRAIVAGITFGIRRREQYGLADGAWVAVGRLEGLLGRTLDQRPVAAVTR